MLSTWNSLNPSDLYKRPECVNDKEFEYSENVNNADLSVQQDAVSTCDSDSSEMCDDIVLAENEKNDPTFGNICVQNSTDIHFGNKTVYQGPVTIKQIVYTNPAIDDAQSFGSEIRKLPINNSPLGEKENGISNGGIKFDCVKPSAIGNSVGHHSGVEKSTKWLQRFSKKHITLVVILLMCVLISLVTLAAVLVAKHISGKTEVPLYPLEDSNEQDKTIPIDSPVDPEVGVVLSGKLKIIPRIQWVAQPPEQPANNLTLPVPYVIIWHTATEFCTNQAECVYHVRNIQTFHMESNHWWDIGYNFLVGGDGFAYEGRGWKSEGAHTYGFNSRSIGIAFIGTFNNILPPPQQIIAAKQLIEKGVEEGYISKDYKLLAARQLSTTQAPGSKLYEDIKKWPHWAKTPL